MYIYNVYVYVYIYKYSVYILLLLVLLFLLLLLLSLLLSLLSLLSLLIIIITICIYSYIINVAHHPKQVSPCPATRAYPTLRFSALAARKPLKPTVSAMRGLSCFQLVELQKWC